MHCLEAAACLRTCCLATAAPSGELQWIRLWWGAGVSNRHTCCGASNRGGRGGTGEWPDNKAPAGALLKEDFLAERLDMHKINTDWGPQIFLPKFLNIQAPPPPPPPRGGLLLSQSPTYCPHIMLLQRSALLHLHAGLTCSERCTLGRRPRRSGDMAGGGVGGPHGRRRAVLLRAGPHAAHQQPGEVGQQDQRRPDQEGLGARSGQAGRHPGAGGPSAPPPPPPEAPPCPLPSMVSLFLLSAEGGSRTRIPYSPLARQRGARRAARGCGGGKGGGGGGARTHARQGPCRRAAVEGRV